jgi:uncharacterized membrane protein YraQ (UPF0718 family)
MEIIFQIIASSAKVFTEAAVYVIFGFIVAGMLRVYIQPDSVAHYFHRGRFRSVLYASLLGVPIPL